MVKLLGRFTFVLHSHLPYVINHGMWPHGMDWLNECAAESYVPILNILNKLVDEGFHPQLTIGVTPVLTEQLRDPAFIEAFLSYLQEKIDAALNDRETFTQWNRPHLVKLTHMWEAFYSNIKTTFIEKYNKDIVLAFKTLQDNGFIEIITCAATHGYLPLLKTDNSVLAQIKTGVQVYQRHYGRAPLGIWLPECAYRPSYWSHPICKEILTGRCTATICPARGAWLFRAGLRAVPPAAIVCGQWMGNLPVHRLYCGCLAVCDWCI